MFQRDAPSPGADLEEMQSLLYLVEEGRAYHSVGKLSLALKRYKAVEKVNATQAKFIFDCDDNHP